MHCFAEEKEDQLKMESEREKEELQIVIDEHKKREQEETDRLKQRHKTYQQDLEMQIGYQQNWKARQKDEEYQEYLAGKVWSALQGSFFIQHQSIVC